MAKKMESMITEFCEGLFTNGSGTKATRLLLVNDPPDGRYVQLTEPQRDLGGLCESVVRDRLIGFAKQIQREAEHG